MSYKKFKLSSNISKNFSSYITEVDERELAKRSAEGDKGAYELIVKKYERFIYRYIYWKVGEVEQARDITADVFIKGFCKIKNFKGESLKFWLMKIAENAVYDFYRKGKKTNEITIEDLKGSDVYKVTSFSSDSEKLVEEKEVRRLLNNAIKRLPDKYSDVIILKYLMGMNTYEISSYLGISTNRVRSRIFRALKRLRKMKEIQELLED